MNSRAKTIPRRSQEESSQVEVALIKNLKDVDGILGIGRTRDRLGRVEFLVKVASGANIPRIVELVDRNRKGLKVLIEKAEMGRIGIPRMSH